LVENAAESGEERDVERDAPEPGERHRTLPLGAFTRFGCWAMYVAVCFTRICVPSNVVE
jgi:4-hydroxybenzoate polyprenyltransferase